MENPVVSVFIPAYDNPIYSRKTLQSIVEQDYRPIEVIFSDDCSPTPLEPMVQEFRKYENDTFRIFFYRQSKNLKTDNFTFGFDHCTGKYVVNMPHDDWWTDRRFLSETVDLMERNPECYLCIANSLLENTDGRTMIHLSASMKNRDTWQIIPGDTYITMSGHRRIGHQAWSGNVFNLPMARSMGAFHYPFDLSMAEANAFGQLAHDSFSFEFLLSSVGSVAITEKVVGVRGQPETSLCNSSHRSSMGQHMFVIHYNLFKADLNGKYVQAVKKRARETIFDWPAERINFKILRHYHYAPDAIWLMSLSYIKHLLRLPRYYVRYYVSLFRRLLRAIRNRELSSLIAKHKRSGILKMLSPFR